MVHVKQKKTKKQNNVYVFTMYFRIIIFRILIITRAE